MVSYYNLNYCVLPLQRRYSPPGGAHNILSMSEAWGEGYGRDPRYRIDISWRDLGFYKECGRVVSLIFPVHIAPKHGALQRREAWGGCPCRLTRRAPLILIAHNYIIRNIRNKKIVMILMMYYSCNIKLKHFESKIHSIIDTIVT